MVKRMLVLIFALASCENLFSQENPEQLKRFREMVYTESPDLNSVAEKIFTQCILTKLYDPLPPALPYKWFSPGGGYVGQWVWDTQFVLAAYASLGADSVIRGVYDNYWYTIDNNPEAGKGSFRYGMVPNFLKDWPPLGYSQIPIIAWGVMQVYRQTGDRQLLEESLPYLLAFDEWYSTERDVDNDGLIEYGAYKPIGNAGMLQTARYEPFDFFPAMDSMKLTRHPRRSGSGEWYGNVEGVEQTCFLLMSEKALVEIAEELGKKELARKYELVIRKRINAIQSKMWNPEKKYFFSLDRDTDKPIDVRCIQGFLAMCCDAVTKEQAKLLAKELSDTAKWWCAYPVPTVSMDDPKFDQTGFWRGDMWPVTTYLVAYGLNRYGYHREAGLLTDKMVELALKYGINERYNGVTGQPLGVTGLGMSCSIWLMITENYYGISHDRNTISVPERAAGRKIRLGKLMVNFPADDKVEMCSMLDKKYRIEFPYIPADQVITVSCEGRRVKHSGLKRSGGSVEFRTLPGRHYSISCSEAK